MKNTNTVAVDLTKSVFQVCVLPKHNKVMKNLRLSRDKFKEFLLTTEASNVVMEACYSSHYWGRFAQDASHSVGLIPAQHITPFVRGNKNDRNDALAIAEASRRSGIRFVPVKTERQQDVKVLHRIRERLVTSRTGLMNQVRGLLSDYGYTFPTGIEALALELRELVCTQRLSSKVRSEIEATLIEYELLTHRIERIQKALADYSSKN